MVVKQNEEKTSVRNNDLFYIKELILERNPMNAINMEMLSIRDHSLVDIRELMQERGLPYSCRVWGSLRSKFTSFSTL